MPPNLRELVRRYLSLLKAKWWLWLGFFIVALVRDLAMQWTNALLDSLGYQLWPFIREFLAWSGPVGLTGLIFGLVLVAILIHAYLEVFWNPLPANTSGADITQRKTQSLIVSSYFYRDQSYEKDTMGALFLPRKVKKRTYFLVIKNAGLDDVMGVEYL